MTFLVTFPVTCPALIDGVATEMAAYLHLDSDHVDSSCHHLDSFLAHFLARLVMVDLVDQPSMIMTTMMKVVTLMRETIEVNLLPAA